MSKTITNQNGVEISYEAIRTAMNGKPFTMRLVKDEGNAVQNVVNVGIDSHLEACYVPDRGDSYKWVGYRLECSISEESFPTLVRRLFESENDTARELAEELLYVLGFKDDGTWKGRKDG